MERRCLFSILLNTWHKLQVYLEGKQFIHFFVCIEASIIYFVLLSLHSQILEKWVLLYCCWLTWSDKTHVASHSYHEIFDIRDILNDVQKTSYACMLITQVTILHSDNCKIVLFYHLKIWNQGSTQQHKTHWLYTE